ncbi:MAG: hypothetical protein GX446_02250 [Chthonomonadales bacterium]|nr:hypothetical protein [Chthonomonadales bacterium]
MRAAIAVVAGLLLAALLAGIGWRLTTRPYEPPARPAPGDTQRPDRTPEAPDLPVPLIPEERERAEYERARRPFMASLSESASSVGCTVGVGEDLSELTVTGSHVGAEAVDAVRDAAFRLGVERQGFRLIRFYERMPDGSGLPPRLVAEVTLRDGRWTTFMR